MVYYFRGCTYLLLKAHLVNNAHLVNHSLFMGKILVLWKSTTKPQTVWLPEISGYTVVISIGIELITYFPANHTKKTLLTIVVSIESCYYRSSIFAANNF